MGSGGRSPRSGSGRYNGPKEILENGRPVWSIGKAATEAGVWYSEGPGPDAPGRFKPPWLIDPGNPDSDLERWILEGIGTVTYFINDRPGKPAASGDGGTAEEGAVAGTKPAGTELVLWTVQDEVATCLGGLTDRLTPPLPSSSDSAISRLGLKPKELGRP